MATISVKPGERLRPGEVALWERHEDHPDGEVFIAAPPAGGTAGSYRVAQTPEVLARLGDGRLVRAGRARDEDDEDEAPAEEAPPARMAAPARRGGTGG